jgi:soluble lytic murein transglycosylase-like protein
MQDIPRDPAEDPSIATVPARFVRKPKLLIALAVSGALTTGFGSSVLTASADVRTVRVTLLSGDVRTLQVDVPPGTPPEALGAHLPDVGEPVVEVVDVTPAPAPEAQAPAAPEPPADAPTRGAGDEDAGASAPERSDEAAEGEQEAAQRRKAERRREAAREREEAAEREATARERDDAAPAPAPQAPAPPASVPEPAAPAGQAAADQAAALTPPEGVPNFFIERFRIPPFLLPIYQAAGIQYGVRWEVLAAINEIETEYGRNLNVSTAGAVGWMQFLPSTWEAYGVDANGDREKDPYNPADAIFAAARYLRAAGADRDLRAAIWAYNHADWYVESVLLRARLIAGMPTDLVGSLSGLTQGVFPVAGKARYEGEVTARGARDGDRPAVTVEGDDARTGIDVEAREGARAVAVQDGTVVAVGTSERLGRYVRLRDAYGNEYTYGGLGDVADRVLVPRERTQTADEIARELRLPRKDPEPKGPASAGEQRRAPADRPARPRGADRTAAAGTAAKERLFANPRRPEPWRHGGRTQVERETALPGDVPLSRWFSLDLGLEREDFELRRLVPGRRVVAGTVLGRLGEAAAGERARVRFELRPAGRGAPRIDPKPILDGWRLLETTAIYRAGGKDPFRTAGTPSVGQLLLMSKEQLQRRVLENDRIDIYECGRRDIAAGVIDQRVLATLEYLAASGLEPTVTSLTCGHGTYTSSGNVSHHTTGSALDIAAINGVPILGHQGEGSVTDQAIRRLLALQGTMKPAQIISLMDYEGADNTVVMADHADHIHVGFRPTFDPDSKEARELAAVLEPGQWIDLVERLGSIENPTVRTEPSKASVRVKPGS